MKEKRGRTLRIVLTVVFAAVFCISAYKLISNYAVGRHEQAEYDALAEIVKTAAKARPTQTAPPQAETEEEEELPKERVMLPEYAELVEMNGDFFGWLQIDGTVIDYPVMHTPSEPQRYIHRAFDGSDSFSGVLFMDGSCYEGCGNYIIYGHHMNNGTMFGFLPKYASEEYWAEHKTILFDTRYEYGEYAVVAAFYSKIYDENEEGFRYYEYTDLTDPERFAEYTAQLAACAIYDTGVTAEYGDELISLSTCNYHTSDGRFVVVAKKITND